MKNEFVRIALCNILLLISWTCYSQGNVGVGVSDPQVKLDVGGAIKIDSSYMQDAPNGSIQYTEDGRFEAMMPHGPIDLGQKSMTHYDIYGAVDTMISHAPDLWLSIPYNVPTSTPMLDMDHMQVLCADEDGCTIELYSKFKSSNAPIATTGVHFIKLFLSPDNSGSTLVYTRVSSDGSGSGAIVDGDGNSTVLITGPYNCFFADYPFGSSDSAKGFHVNKYGDPTGTQSCAVKITD